MKVEDWLNEATHILKKVNIATARLDCLVLLEDEAKKDKAWLLAHSESELSGVQLKKLESRIKRRTNHEPLAYIRGKSEFYGREFIVSPDTLEPRPETETMIDVLQQLVESDQTPLLVDVGTGSGCIAVTAKLELPNCKIIGTEINESALKIAKQNAKKFKAKVEFYKGNLLEPVSTSEPFALLCNLPYVPDSYKLNQAAKWEPQMAIFGGKDGLDLYRQLFEQVKDFGLKPGFILTESLPTQHKELAKIATQSGYKQKQTDDFIQVFAPNGL